MTNFKKLLSCTIISAAALLLTSCRYPIENSGSFGSGDLDNDGKADMSDAVWLEEYLLGIAPENEIETIRSLRMDSRFDLNLDGEVDVFDMVLMRKDMVSGNDRLPVLWRVDEVDSDGISEQVFTDYGDYSEFMDAFSLDSDKYSEETFDSYDVLVKPFVQSAYGSYLNLSVTKVYYSGDDVVICVDESYDTIISHEEDEVLTDLQVLAQVAVPKGSYKNVVWEQGRICWDSFLNELKNNDPEIYEDKRFEFESPDGSREFIVYEKVEKYPDCDAVTSFDFYVYDGDVNSFRTLRVREAGAVYRPFYDGNYELVWDGDMVTVSFTADKDYSYTFQIPEKTT